MESKFKELSVIDCGEYIETIPQGNRESLVIFHGRMRGSC